MAPNASPPQVFVGKLGENGDDGQISVLTLPEKFEWLKYFTAGELVEFFSELLAALTRASASGDFAEVTDLIEAWQATAEINSDTTLTAEIEEGLREIENDEVITLEDLQANLEISDGVPPRAPPKVGPEVHRLAERETTKGDL